MTERRSPTISSRKEPRQTRSAGLVADILEAATRVLAEEGARRFTTARVAERAGVSVGSLYQYFPNKAAILFRLQSREWHETAALLQSILAVSERPPLERLRAMVHAFLRSECEEAEMRGALSDSAPLYRDAPEAREARAAGEAAIGGFMHEVLPDAPTSVRERMGELITTTLSTVGKDFSRRPRRSDEIDTYADALADMFCAYLEQARSSRARSRKVSAGSPRRYQGPN